MRKRRNTPTHENTKRRKIDTIRIFHEQFLDGFLEAPRETLIENSLFFRNALEGSTLSRVVFLKRPMDALQAKHVIAGLQGQSLDFSQYDTRDLMRLQEVFNYFQMRSFDIQTALLSVIFNDMLVELNLPESSMKDLVDDHEEKMRKIELLAMCQKMKNAFESPLWDRVNVLTYAGEGDTIIHFKVDERNQGIYLELSFLISRPNDQKIVWVVSPKPDEFPSEVIITINQTIKDSGEELDRIQKQIEFVSSELKPITKRFLNRTWLTRFYGGNRYEPDVNEITHCACYYIIGITGESSFIIYNYRVKEIPHQFHTPIPDLCMSHFQGCPKSRTEAKLLYGDPWIEGYDGCDRDRALSLPT